MMNCSMNCKLSSINDEVDQSCTVNNELGLLCSAQDDIIILKNKSYLIW